MWNHVEELRRYFDIWSGSFMIFDLLARFQNLSNYYELLKKYGGYNPHISSYGRFCATETKLIPTNVFTNIIFVVDKEELNFEPVYYTRALRDRSNDGCWYNLSRTKFFYDTIFPYEVEFFTTDFVPITSIKEIWIYKNAWIQGVAERNAEFARKIGEEYDIPVIEKRLVLTRSDIVGLAFGVFDDLWSFYLEYSIKDYQSVYSYLRQYPPLMLDLSYLVDKYHEFEDARPLNYSYTEKVIITNENMFYNEMGKYINNRIYTLFGTSNKPLLRERIERFVWKLLDIYLDIKL